MLAALIVAAIVGILVYIVATFFDRTSDNRYAAIAGFLVFLLVFLTRSGLDL